MKKDQRPVIIPNNETSFKGSGGDFPTIIILALILSYFLYKILTH